MSSPIEHHMQEIMMTRFKNVLARRARRICLFGASLDNWNLGVQALADSLIGLCIDADSEAEITLLYAGRQAPHIQPLEVAGRIVAINIFNYRMSPRAELRIHIIWILLLAVVQRIVPLKSVREMIIRSNLMLNLLYHADVIGDIRGGDSFSDIYGLKSFSMSNLPLLIVILLRKSYVLLPQTYGPFSSPVSRWIAKIFLRYATRVYARDFVSLDTVQKILCDNGDNRNRVQFCPDVAFSLVSKMPDQIDAEPPLNMNGMNEIIGLNISGLLYSGGFTMDNMFGLKFSYKSFVNDLSKRLLQIEDCHVLLIPHTWGSGDRWAVESDPYACYDVFSQLPIESRSRAHILTRNYNAREAKGIIGLCTFIIGSRMHACIGAISQGVPTVAIAYSRKFIGVFSSVGLEDMVLDGRILDLQTTVSLILGLVRNKSDYNTNLPDRVEIARRQLRETFQELLSAPSQRDGAGQTKGEAAQ